MSRTYSKKAQHFVKQAVHEYKRGKLKSGQTKKPVKNREQANAIGLSKTRQKGIKVPKKK